MFKKQISYKLISLLFGILVICFAVGFYVFADWSEPTASPPEGNVSAPLNVGLDDQTKSGGLTVGGIGLTAPAIYDSDDLNRDYFIDLDGQTGTDYSAILKGKVGIYKNPDSTDTVEEMLRLTRDTAGGEPEVGLGESIDFYMRQGLGTIGPGGTPGEVVNTSRIASVWNNPDFNADLVFYTLAGGTTWWETMRLAGDLLTARRAEFNNLRVVNKFFIATLSVDGETGLVGIGTADPKSKLQVDGYIQMKTNNGVPLAGDCNNDTERGRMIHDYSNNRLYICGGAARGWDYVDLTD